MLSPEKDLDSVVVNAVEEGHTLDDIFDFVSDHVDSWGSRQVLWDLTLLGFQSIDSHSVRSLVDKPTRPVDAAVLGRSARLTWRYRWNPRSAAEKTSRGFRQLPVVASKF